jgi:hypothetical protein
MRNALMKPENAGAASTPYLYLMALVALGDMWLRLAASAQRRIAQRNDPDGFAAAKLTTAAFFCCYLLPETAVHRARVEVGAEPLMALAADAF